MIVDTALGDGTAQTIYNRNRVSAALDAGKAYVKGYEYESIGTDYVDVKKGRDVLTETSFPINPNFGNSVKVTNFTAGNSLETVTGNPFNAETLSVTYDLHCVPLANIVSTNSNTYNSTKMGTTRIRQIDYSSGAFTNTSTSNTAVLDAYIFDTQFSPLTVNVGTVYTSGETSIELETLKTSTKENAYNGAKISIGTETRVIDDYAATSNTATINLGCIPKCFPIIFKSLLYFFNMFFPAIILALSTL